ncbi:MAG: hypothetical protein LBB75_03180, partial [Oscillospiraceae bacterium]|nr:hypothetical protein [Oscillospiraceae bacterium]
MIKQIDWEFTPWDIFGARILAAYRSYCGMKECQFFAGGMNAAPTAVLSLVDGFAILSAKPEADWEELAAFLRMQPWSRLQCDAGAAAMLPFPAEWRSAQLRFAAPPVPGACPPAPAPDPGVVYDILARCFPGMGNRADWMADLALRWRRGTA